MDFNFLNFLSVLADLLVILMTLLFVAALNYSFKKEKRDNDSTPE